MSSPDGQTTGWQRHPVAYQRRTRNLPPRQGLASLGLRQTLVGAGEPESGQSPGDGMAGPQVDIARAEINSYRSTTTEEHQRRRSLSNDGSLRAGQGRRSARVVAIPRTRGYMTSSCRMRTHRAVRQTGAGTKPQVRITTRLGGGPPSGSGAASSSPAGEVSSSRRLSDSPRAAGAVSRPYG
jgi:hypothetical protein